MRARYLPFFVALFVCFLLVEPPPVQAYIGPGAGFAFVSSFFAILAAFLLAFLKLITYPFRWLFRTLRWRKALKRARVRQVVVLGLDGQDPELTDRFLEEGMLPNFARLREQGSYVRLDTSFPAESPVAWSCFQTGCNPGRHRVFDFLVPTRRSYLPELCSAKVTAQGRVLKLGKYRFPLGKPTIDLGRKSKSFWKILGDHGIFSTVIRVPITFPPEKFHGALLSAMCVPDLKGSQGTFSYYSTDREEQAKFTGGIQIPIDVRDGVIRSYISGPDNTMVEGAEEMRIPFEVRLGTNGAAPQLVIDKKVYPLQIREYTPWIDVKFRPALKFGVRGICRAGPLRHTRAGRGHLGAQRAGAGRGSVSQAGLVDPRGARASVLRCAGKDEARQRGLRLRHHRPLAAHVLPLPGTRSSGQCGQGCGSPQGCDPRPVQEDG
jgi:hypothetical protein